MTMIETQPAYPLPGPPGDIPPKLVAAVAEAITAAGFPEIDARADLRRLDLALRRFVYGDDVSAEDRGTAAPGATVDRVPGGGISVSMNGLRVESGASVVGVQLDSL